MNDPKVHSIIVRFLKFLLIAVASGACGAGVVFVSNPTAFLPQTPYLLIITAFVGAFIAAIEKFVNWEEANIQKEDGIVTNNK